MKKWLKKVMAKVLPRGVIQRIRRWHAPRVAARFTDADWQPAPVIRALVQRGDVVVDVGANMGYIAARLADYVGPEGRVYAVEPVPDTFALLKRTVEKCSLKQVRALHACASNEMGELFMAIPEYAYGAENLYESRVIEGGDPAMGGRRVAVRAVPLDELLADEKRRIVFMKIDVEGHERAVLEGSARIIEKNGPALFIEISGDPDEPESQAACVFADLRRRGYVGHRWDGRVLRERVAGDRSVDYFFLRHEHRPRVVAWLDKTP